MEFYELKNIVNDAIEKIYTRESYLIEYGLSEWTIAAQFHYYMRKKCQKSLKGYSFDSEYNLMSKIENKGYVQKCIFVSEEPLKVRPDFIIHKRVVSPKGGDAKGNFLWVEMKRVGGKKWEKDLKRVSAVTRACFTKNGVECVTGYAYGLGILFHKKKVICKWFMNGNEKLECIMTKDSCGVLRWLENNKIS